MAKHLPRTVEPTIRFWGAAQCVTGSMHQVDACGQSLLLDCGMMQGGADDLRRNRAFPFRPRDIDAVLLSHAHIDHAGNLPNLVKQGFAGPIYCTPATRALLSVVLGDAAKIHEQEAERRNSRRGPGEPPVEPLYTGRDVYRTLIRLNAVPYDAPFPLGRGLEAKFVNSGHLLGSAMIHLRIDGAGGERQVTFTGDLGRAGLPILRAPDAIPPADIVLCESTYGGRTHEPVDEALDRLAELIQRTAARGGRLLIPAFSVGRTQTIVYFLHQLLRAGRLPDVPIYVDSPMAVRATEVFQAHPECFDEPTLAMLQRHPDLFGEERITYVEKVHESLALNHEPGPCVIISASGMCEAGRVLYHLQRVVEDRRSTILIAGYQAEGTLGRRIAERRPEVRILGRAYTLKADVAALGGFSCHPDHEGLLEHLRPLTETARKVRLVHGEPAGAAALAEGLRVSGFADVAVPARGDAVAI
jgi:metallo-beta-lactamase family protein